MPYAIPFGDCSYNPSTVILGAIYYRAYHFSECIFGELMVNDGGYCIFTNKNGNFKVRMGYVTLCNHQYDIWLWVSSLSEIPFCLPVYCGCSYLERTRINHSNSSWINSNRSIRNWEIQQFGISENGVYAVYAILTYTLW